jgi:hypothetical protein
MRNFLEHVAVNAKVIAERTTDKGKELDVEVKFQQADTINDNKRLYPKGLLTREVNKINEKIRKGESVWAHSFHPPDGIGKPTDIAGRWKKCWIETDGACYGRLTILPTEAGKTMRVLARAGRIGISSRGFGQTTKKSKMVGGKTVKYLEVNPDYVMASPGDFVVAPSVQGAYASVNEELNQLGLLLDKADDFSGVGMGFDQGKTPEQTLKIIYRAYVEKGYKGTFDDFKKFQSKENKEKSKDGTMKKSKILRTLSPKKLEKQMEFLYRLDPNFQGSFEQWKEKNELRFLTLKMVQEGYAENEAQALEMLGKKIETKAPKQQRVKPADVVFEAKILGISAEKYAERINASADMGEEIENEKDLEPEEKIRILKEARDAGQDISNPEIRKKIFESAKMTKNSKSEIPTLTEEEKKKASKMTARYLEERISGGKNTQIK